MYDREVLVEKLYSLLEALERIPRRFAGIAGPADFYASDAGIDRMDAICMILIAAGEELKSIDRKDRWQAAERLSRRQMARRNVGTKCLSPCLLSGERRTTIRYLQE
ncbi:MAG: hypothetical protein WCD88_05640 [Desulfobacterales bacterium]